MSVMTGQRIKEYGEAIWGPGWVFVLAQRLGTTKKTIRRWRDGENNPPRDFRANLESLVDEQIALLCKIKDEMNGR